MEEFLNDSYEKQCGDFELQYIEVQYFGNEYLTYLRNGKKKYFINSITLAGEGNHNLDLSVLDINVSDYEGQC